MRLDSEAAKDKNSSDKVVKALEEEIKNEN